MSHPGPGPRPKNTMLWLTGALALVAVTIGVAVVIVAGRRHGDAPPVAADNNDRAGVGSAPASSARKVPAGTAMPGVARPPVPKAAPPETTAPATAHFDEAALMTKLRALEGTDPPLTLRLAREGNAHAPDSPDAAERAWMAVKALTNMERFQDAQAEARVMVAKYPGTSWSMDVQRHLLSNPLQ